MAKNARYLLLPIALLQLVSAYLPSALGFPPIGERATAMGIPPELPLGVFFAIWGIIFAAYVTFSIYALRANTYLTRQLSYPLAASGLVTALWMPVQQIIGQPVLDLILLGPLVYFSWLAAFRFDQMRGLGGSPIKWTSDVLTGLLSGWSAVAVAISVPRAWRDIMNQGPTDAEWFALWCVLGTIVLATFVFKRFVSRTLWYYAAATWGLLGILLNNWLRTGYGYLGWVTLFFALWILYRRLRGEANGSRRSVI